MPVFVCTMCMHTLVTKHTIRIDEYSALIFAPATVKFGPRTGHDILQAFVPLAHIIRNTMFLEELLNIKTALVNYGILSFVQLYWLNCLRVYLGSGIPIWVGVIRNEPFRGNIAWGRIKFDAT